jgi:hypothetical protein
VAGVKVVWDEQHSPNRFQVLKIVTRSMQARGVAHQGVEYMLCGGLNRYPTPAGNTAFGGLELVDLRTNRPEHQVPVNLYVDEGAGANAGLVVTNNAFWVEPLGDGNSLRAYFMTETNNQANLLIYDATPWVNK